MKKYLQILLVLLTLPLCVAQGDLIYRDDLVLDLNIHSTADIDAYSSQSYLENVKINLNYDFEDSYRQKTLDITTNPDARVTDKISFVFDNPKGEQISWEVNIRVETKGDFFKVTKKPGFPITQYPIDVYEYTKPTQMIDLNSDIRSLAAEIAEGEDDLYIVVFKLAAWTNKNIEYDLSSIAADAVQPSSWVLKNKKGVCDELTNLFISMCRSLGIPARFVTGVSYTNDPAFKKPWGLHGWAEVYFPGYGWVPFDPTYGEYGYVDAGHISLKTSADSNKTSTEYVWKGRFVDILPNAMAFDVDVQKEGELILPNVDLGVQIFDDNVGFGSYNYVEAVVENKNNYYATASLYIGVPEELTVLDGTEKPVVLRPYETKSVFWKFKVPENLNKDYRYTFPVVVSTAQNFSVQSSFKSDHSQNVLDFQTITGLVAKKESEYEKESEVAFYCLSEKNEVPVGEKVNISCTLSNKKTEPLYDVSVCLETSCRKTSVGAGKEVIINFEKQFSSSGYNFFRITAKNTEVSKVAYATVMSLDVPKITISELKYPKNANFSEPLAISFTMSKASYAAPKDAKVIVYFNKNKEQWDVGEIEGILPFTVELPGSYLNFGQNSMRMIVEYKDEKGNSYSTEESFTITLNETTWPEKIQVVLNQFAFFVERMLDSVNV